MYDIQYLLLQNGWQLPIVLCTLATSFLSSKSSFNLLTFTTICGGFGPLSCMSLSSNLWTGQRDRRVPICVMGNSFIITVFMIHIHVQHCKSVFRACFIADGQWWRQNGFSAYALEVGDRDFLFFFLLIIRCFWASSNLLAESLVDGSTVSVEHIGLWPSWLSIRLPGQELLGLTVVTV